MTGWKPVPRVYIFPVRCSALTREKNGQRCARSFFFAVIPTEVEGSRAARRDFSAFSTLGSCHLGLTLSTRAIFFCRAHRLSCLCGAIAAATSPVSSQETSRETRYLPWQTRGRGRAGAGTHAGRRRWLRRSRVPERLGIMHPLKVLLMV